MSRSVSQPPWHLSGHEKREQVREMFESISPTYDAMNSVMSLGLHRRWRAYAVRLLALEPGDSALDLCCGTGDFAYPLRKAVGSQGAIVGLDFSAQMLARAKQKDAPMTPTLGDACALPFQEERFDAITVGWGLRNVADLDACLRECHRVLKPGGRLVSVDMAVPTNPVARLGARVVGGWILPTLGALVGRREAYTYLPKSTESFDSPESLARRMTQVGFTEPLIRRLFFGNIAVVRCVKP
ncbi:MAG: bifunctional demethylmenaquinone methyltransferase/2-methoxy-6-polyprenyl-1,4-benzoquinol methylase UbiE [Armatimonadetes bacterium]|nr:MAG: bifunctional demethylmenaquinone methyltransferase/2-methoxy-6-polyprenyl-1,4-benzoquinol methylase UbiE [Armatimonadota bacterium]